MTELSKSAKKQLDNSYKYGSKILWDSLEEDKNKNLDDEAVAMEILYQVTHFLGNKGWPEAEMN